MRSWRSAVVIAAAVVALAVVNMSIAQKARLLAEGRVVLLELAPVDPRSLMQGDYMDLRFRVADDAASAVSALGKDGALIVTVDDLGVGRFERIDDGRPLGARELRLHYRWRNFRVKLGTNAFFFEEGTAGRYANAGFGEFRVDEDGEMVLTALRGRDRQPL